MNGRLAVALLAGIVLSAICGCGGGSDAGVPVIAVTPTTLAFGAGTNTLTFAVSNSGTGTLTWQAAPSDDWITVTPTSGTDAGTVTVTVDRTQAAAAARQATITGSVNLTSNGGTATVTVTATTTPTVEIIMDNADATGVTITGNWQTAGAGDGNGCYGADFLYLHSDEAAGTVRFTPTIETAGTYGVYIFWSAAANRTINQPVTVHDSTGTDETYHVNLQENGNAWYYLGDHAFGVGTDGYVEFSNQTGGEAGFCNADAVRFYMGGSGPVTGMEDRVFFLHPSTGQGVLDAGMRGVVATYNAAHRTNWQLGDHGYNSEGRRDASGADTGTSYNIPNDDTDPAGLHYLWTSTNADAVAARNLILDNYRVIAFKSCFPNSAITDAAMLAQYQSYYEDMMDVFDAHPDHVFVVMSTPPLHRLGTEATQAANARAFANWISSNAYLGGHTNVVCFNVFDYLAQADDGTATANMLRYDYEQDHGVAESHPNAAGNAAVATPLAEALLAAAES